MLRTADIKRCGLVLRLKGRLDARRRIPPGGGFAESSRQMITISSAVRNRAVRDGDFGCRAESSRGDSDSGAAESRPRMTAISGVVGNRGEYALFRAPWGVLRRSGAGHPLAPTARRLLHDVYAFRRRTSRTPWRWVHRRSRSAGSDRLAAFLSMVQSGFRPGLVDTSGRSFHLAKLDFRS